MPESEKNPLYFIAIMPPASVRAEIEHFKKEIKENFGIKHALKLPAHITLQIPFRMHERKEDILFKKLEKFSRQHEIFQTELEDFGKFSKNVIFINVKNHEPFIFLYEKLKEIMLNFLNLKSHEISSKIHPHITIATRDLKRSNFPKVWNEFKDRNYTAAFKVDALYLLKHNGKTWDICRKFRLGNKI